MNDAAVVGLPGPVRSATWGGTGGTRNKLLKLRVPGTEPFHKRRSAGGTGATYWPEGSAKASLCLQTGRLGKTLAFSVNKLNDRANRS